MKTDREQRGLRGPVETVYTETLRFGPADGRPAEKFWYAHTARFDAGGSIAEETYHNPDGTAFRSAYSYDRAGRLAALARFDERGNPAGQTTRTYDERGRLAAEWYSDSRGPARSRKTYTYDGAGRMTSEEVFDDGGGLPEGIFERDGAEPPAGGRGEGGPSCLAGPVEVFVGVEGTDASFGARGLRSIKTVFDARGNPVDVSAYGPRRKLRQKILLAYDERGLPVREAQYGVGEMFTCGAPTFWGRLLAPVGSRLVRAYLFAKGLRAARRSWHELARAVAYGPLMSETTYGYDAEGRRAERAVCFFGVVVDRTLYRYDERGNIAEEIYEHGADARPTTRAFMARAYDERGNWIEESVSSVTDEGAPQPSHVSRRTITYY